MVDCHGAGVGVRAGWWELGMIHKDSFVKLNAPSPIYDDNSEDGPTPQKDAGQ